MATIYKGRWCRNVIQEDTERDYSQTIYGKNALVVGDGGDGENPSCDDVTRANFEEWI